jgi:hypothetical protein
MALTYRKHGTSLVDSGPAPITTRRFVRSTASAAQTVPQANNEIRPSRISRPRASNTLSTAPLRPPVATDRAPASARSRNRPHRQTRPPLASS